MVTFKGISYRRDLDHETHDEKQGVPLSVAHFTVGFTFDIILSKNKKHKYGARCIFFLFFSPIMVPHSVV